MSITLKLDPSPTFWSKVDIPIPGAPKGVEIECEFGHMDRDAFAVFTDTATARTDIDGTMAILRSWRGPDAAFSREAVAKLLQNYHGASFAITEKFCSELGKLRSGN